MSSTPTVREFQPNEWPTYRDLRLQALTQAPDAFGSTLCREQSRSDSDWAERLGAGTDSRWNFPLLAELGFDPVGLAWGRIDPSCPERADLYQMWVHPGGRRLGAGRLLLDTITAWAKDAGALFLVLGAACGDSPANRLYSRAGFRRVGEPHPLRPGSLVFAQEMHFQLRDGEA
jgi:GNAT superfamily N-acetyltransferase